MVESILAVTPESGRRFIGPSGHPSAGDRGVSGKQVSRDRLVWLADHQITGSPDDPICYTVATPWTSTNWRPSWKLPAIPAFRGRRRSAFALNPPSPRKSEPWKRKWERGCSIAAAARYP